MTYTVKFTDFNNKGSLTVNDSTTNTETSIGFPGRNVRGYGITIAENFLHILENFASEEAPVNPIEGQLWYDTGNQDLKVYDSTTWKSAGSVRKSSTPPQVGVLGDLWVDTDNQQLFLYNGATWILVGPTFSSGLKSGVQPETVIDANGNERIVLKIYVEDEVVAIYSVTEFVPKLTIEGFSNIKPGINVSTKAFPNTTLSNRLWGVAEKAESLLIGTTTVAASNFLRKDTSNITNFGFTVRNNNGINVGGEGQFKMAVDSGQVGNLYHSTPNSALELRINRGGDVPTTLIRCDSNGRVGIGINNFVPEETLDVDGTAVISGDVRITSTNNTINNVTGALRVAGGVNIQRDLIVKGNASFTGHLTVGEVGTGNVSIIPTENNKFDIGTKEKRFSTIWASTIQANVIGNIEGNITGNVNGTSVRLLSSTNFTMSGDVIDVNGFSFDGQTGGTVKTFNTTISPTFIETKDEVSDVSNNDYLLIFRSGGGGLKKISRPTFFTQVPTVPIGAIFPFAGTVIPAGYLLCDGSEKQRVKYTELFDVIGFTYGDPSSLLGLGTFRIPDLRGRFPLGRNNMDNGDTVPNGADGGATNIDSSTAPAINRVTDSTASIVGNSSGAEQRTLTVANLPDHRHDLTGDAGTQYYVTNNNAGIPADSSSLLGNGPSAAGQGQFYPRTGSMITSTGYSAPINTMNPYLTINYIIYAGRVS